MGSPRGEAVCECVKRGRVRAGGGGEGGRAGGRGGGRERRVEGRVSNGSPP